ETRILYVAGDATEPRGSGPKLITHVVNDKTPNWGGRGFAKALARRYPEVQQLFRAWAAQRSLATSLGDVHFHQISPELYVASMVSQRGYGPSPTPRIRYDALQACLGRAASFAADAGLSIHMPRIGCGEAGGTWEVVEKLIHLTASASGVP